VIELRLTKTFFVSFKRKSGADAVVSVVDVVVVVEVAIVVDIVSIVGVGGGGRTGRNYNNKEEETTPYNEFLYCQSTFGMIVIAI
jgi:hypothetical protein